MGGKKESIMSREARIVRVAKREDPFARIDKKMLDDERLSFKSKGILSYLLGKPDDWKLRVADLVKHSREGIDSIRAGLMELRRLGYAELVRTRDAEGKMLEWTWKVSESPVFKPETGNPNLGNPHRTKKEPTKNEKSKEPKGTAVPAVDDSIPAKWKPDTRTKAEKLRTMPVPKNYPSERDFDDFCYDQGLDEILSKRCDLYETLCNDKWHQWKADDGKPIRDWRKYVVALNEHMLR